MDPVQILLSLADRYGVPIAVVVVLGYALAKRIIILGSEKERSDAAWERELAYREERRVEERTRSAQSEAAVKKLADGVSKMAENMDEITTAVVSSLEKDAHRG